MARILLIDDDDDFSRLLTDDLQQRGHQVACLEGAQGGVEALAEPKQAGSRFDLVLVDNRMPGMSGLAFLTALRERELRVPVILMTGHGTADTAIQAMNRGAFDYVIKQLDLDEFLDELEPLIRDALDMTEPTQRVILPNEADSDDASGVRLLGNCPEMVNVYKWIGRFGKSDVPVLILGETGTGKELVARAIHDCSRRKNGPFVAMNCTALNESLLEDELFGHEPGAFTGAAKLRKGRFEYADGGTLFLDEVGDMPPKLQAALLRVLEQQQVERQGSNEAIKVDVRVLSATHRDMESAVREGKFREDLFYRLNGKTIDLPPLRQRGDDLKKLAEHFLAAAAHRAGQPVPTFHESCWETLARYSWPGNIRELRNVVQGAYLDCLGSQVMPKHLRLRAQASAAAGREDGVTANILSAIHGALQSSQRNLLPYLTETLERELVRITLSECEGNQVQTAKRLGISRNGLRAKMKAYGLL